MHKVLRRVFGGDSGWIVIFTLTGAVVFWILWLTLVMVQFDPKIILLLKGVAYIETFGAILYALQNHGENLGKEKARRDP